MLETADEIITNELLWAPNYRHNSVYRSVKNYIRQLCADTRCHIENLQRAIADRDGRRFRESGESLLSARLDNNEEEGEVKNTGVPETYLYDLRNMIF